MDQPRKVAKPARGQLNREIKCPCRSIRGKCIRSIIYVDYWYSTAVCICLCTRYYIFLFGDMYIRARFTAVYAYMCNYSGMYVELCLYVWPSQPNRARSPILVVVN